MSGAGALTLGEEAEGIVACLVQKRETWGVCVCVCGVCVWGGVYKDSSPVPAERLLGRQIQALYRSAWEETMDVKWIKLFSLRTATQGGCASLEGCNNLTG